MGLRPTDLMRWLYGASQIPWGVEASASDRSFLDLLMPTWMMSVSCEAQRAHTHTSNSAPTMSCLLYTSDAADDTPCVDL
eukprot:6412681-Amphidinium_carterae.1